MSRDDLLTHSAMQCLQAFAARLIGIGGVLVLMPVLFASTPVSVTTRAFAPFGWLVLLVGFASLSLRVRQGAERIASSRWHR